MPPVLRLTVDGEAVEVPDDGGSLLDLLRDRLGRRSVKDGCSPQGQCGCCTVWVDGNPRASCVTAARRVAGRQVTTLDGLPDDVRRRWAQAFVDHGASQCGFCTPGILMRLIAAVEPVGTVGGAAATCDPTALQRSLAAHLCRCTGWRPIVDAALDVASRVSAAAASEAPVPPGTQAPAAAVVGLPASAATRLSATASGSASPAILPRDLLAAGRRAALEGGVPQQVGLSAALGSAGFAEDTAPTDALVAVPGGDGGWIVADTLAEARVLAGKTQGRRTTLPVRFPLQVPDGDWDLVLTTTFVEPAYLEPDASWCVPGGDPATPLANGGAFGGKLVSSAPAIARDLADRYGRPVRVVLSREDVVRMGPKRPPIAAGVSAGGRGIIRVARTPGSDLSGWVEALASVAPGLTVELVDVPGPPVSATLRGAGWVEGAVLLAGLGMLADGAPGPVGRSAVPPPPVASKIGAVEAVGRGGAANKGAGIKRAGNGNGNAAANEAAGNSDGDGNETRSDAKAGGGPKPAAWVRSPAGAVASAAIDPAGAVTVTIDAGTVLDEVVLRSYCVGATHQALGWVRTEGVAVDEDGVVHDLTIRSFGVLPARAMPGVAVTVRAGDGPPVPGGDAVFAAVAAAAWAERGFVAHWPSDPGGR